MAEIPVERKEGGFPWWLIPLILLLLLLPLLYFTCGRNTAVDTTNGNGNRTATVTNGGSANRGGNTTAATTTSGTSGNTAVVVNSDNNGSASNAGVAGANGSRNTNSGSVITDVNFYGNTADKNSLVGRGLFVNGVTVNRVLSDRIFTVKSGSGEMFVMLGENLDSGGGKEQQIRIRAGQTVNLGGEFRTVPNAETKDEQSRDLNQKEYAQMKGQQTYLHANSVADAK